MDEARKRRTPDQLAEKAGVKLRRSGKELRGQCPLCGAGKSSAIFAVSGDHWRCYGCNPRGGDVVDLWVGLYGGTIMEAAREIVGPGWEAKGAVTPRERKTSAHQGPSKAELVAVEIWGEVRPLAGSLAETYLRRRGIAPAVIEAAGANLRFHPNAKHSWSGRDGRWRRAPAMVVQVVTPAGPTGGVHATYLDRATAGKARFADDDGGPMPAKRMWGPQGDATGQPGGAWLIGPDGPGDLVVGEGIETGLSVATLALPAGLPIRAAAALSLGRLQGGWARDDEGCIDPFAIQADPATPAFTWPAPADSPWREVLIAVDRDMGELRVKARTGRGKVCWHVLPAEVRARLCGRLAVTAWKAAGAARARAIAPAPGRDFNDELRARLAREGVA